MIYRPLWNVFYVKKSLRRAMLSSYATPALVKILRERTGAPMMDCKKALEVQDIAGNIDKAIDWLRAKGIAKAASISSSGRTASEGLIALYKSSEHEISLVEINSETDFVARNEEFQKFAVDVAMSAANQSRKNAVLSSQEIVQSISLQSRPLQDVLGDIIAKIRENIVVRRMLTVSGAGSSNSTILHGAYIHGRLNTNLSTDVQLGRSASVVEVEVSPAFKESEIPSFLTEAVKKLAMHVVAAKPSYLGLKDIPSELIAKETAIFREQSDSASSPNAKAKSPEIMEKIIMGKVNKRLAEIVLLEQPHVAEEGSPVVSKHLDVLGKMIGSGSKIRITRFVHWTLGQELQ